MNSTFKWALGALVVGVGCGVALGFWEARPWTLALTSEPPRPTAAAPTNARDARAVIAETEFNFDRMESGAEQGHAFPIRNDGGRPLTVTFVSHTCKCTTVKLDGKDVEPGDSILIPPGEEKSAYLVWAAKVPAGPFRHGATFTTNDPAQPRLELTVNGEIVESTTLYPSQLVFPNVRVGEPATAELLVIAFVEPEVQILTHEVEEPKLAEKMQVRVEPVEKDKLPSPEARAGVKIIAQYDPGGALGQFSGTLRLDTNLKQSPRLLVPIFGTVKGDVSLFGKGWSEANGLLRMDPATTAAGGASQLNVAIRGEHAGETELSVAEVSPPELKASLGKPHALRKDLVHVPLTVEIPAGTRPMVMAGEDQGGEGEIILATTHPNTKEVRLRVTFTVKP